jgi:GNAT superfamily N-acetyltransferase
MGQRFIAESSYSGRIRQEPQALVEAMAGLVVSSDAEVLVAGDPVFAMVGGFVFSHPFSGERVACESFWWVEPERRGSALGVRLVRRLEAWARAKGAARMIMVQPTGSERIGQIYQRLGYASLEEQYQKDL